MHASVPAGVNEADQRLLVEGSNPTLRLCCWRRPAQGSDGQLASWPTALPWPIARPPSWARPSMGASSYVVPGIAVLLSWLFLAEVPEPLALLGGAISLLGVAITRIPGVRQAEPDLR